MSELKRIGEVYLYVGLSEGALECLAVRAILKAQGIPYVQLAYNDEGERETALGPLSTWVWGDGEPKQFTDFPVVHWTEFYDDWTQKKFCATSVDELQRSSLIANKSLVANV